MSDMTAYRTSSPAVLTAYEAAQDAVIAYKEQVGNVLESLGVGHLTRFGTTGHRPGRFAGLARHGVADEAPAGWRLDVKNAVLVPDLRSKAGKAAAKALDSVRYPGDPRDALPGMPSMLLVPPRLLRPGAEMLGGSLYLTWTCDGKALGDAVDPDIWEHVRLSAYYAAVEAETAGAP